MFYYFLSASINQDKINNWSEHQDEWQAYLDLMNKFIIYMHVIKTN